MQPLPAFQVLDTLVHATSPTDALERIRVAIGSRTGIWIVFCTVSTVVTARRDPALRAALRGAALVAPDGMPLVWIGRSMGHQVERTYGPDFMIELFERTGATFRHYFYGGRPGVAKAMVEKLLLHFPELEVAGYKSPPAQLNPLSPPPQDIQEINESRADILWIGLGHPNQEIFMHRQRERLDVPVLAAVGAAFDFHAGVKKESPKWMKRAGLQWVHRLITEPRRLWRRYLIGNSVFIGLLFRDWARSRFRRLFS